jgi:hypothetical protein
LNDIWGWGSSKNKYIGLNLIRYKTIYLIYIDHEELVQYI